MTEGKNQDEITRTDGAYEPQDFKDREKSSSYIDFHQQPNEIENDDEDDDFEVQEDVPESVKQKVFERMQQRGAKFGPF